MKWLVLLLVLPFTLIAGRLLLNRLPLLSPPSPLERIKTYLTTNVAETRVDHEFPELRPRLIPASANETRDAVVAAMRTLGWREIQAFEGEARAVVVSPLFRFRDDVTVRFEATPDGILLNAGSGSRIGKADMAANASHIVALFAGMERLLHEPG
jgi:uncharacterized protein (DUF1499 family)